MRGKDLFGRVCKNLGEMKTEEQKKSGRIEDEGFNVKALPEGYRFVEKPEAVFVEVEVSTEEEVYAAMQVLRDMGAASIEFVDNFEKGLILRGMRT